MATVSGLAFIVLYPMLGSFDQEGMSPHLIVESFLTGSRASPADGQNGLRGGDVVAGVPLVLVGDCAEILLDQLLSPRKSLSSAHESLS